MSRYFHGSSANVYERPTASCSVDVNHELDLLGAGDDPRTALRAVLSWSYQWLPAQAARAFRLLHAAAQAMDLLLVAPGPTRVHLGDASERTIPITDPVSTRGWLDTERANLVPGAEQARQAGGPRRIARLAQSVAAYLDHDGQHADSRVGLPHQLGGEQARLVGC